MEGPEAGRFRNVAIIAHGGAGKTSLAEAVLFNTRAIDRLGRVEEGTTTLDYEPEEIERKITVTTAVACCRWKDHEITLLDTPGYINFIEDTRAALRVTDGAVVLVSALSGVKPGTERVWDYSCEYEIPRIAFVNKMDRDQANFFRALGDMEKSFERTGLALQIPIGAGENFSGVVDLVTQKAHFFEGEKGGYREGDIPAEAAEEAKEYRKRLVETVAETDDALIEVYLAQGDLSEEEIRRGLREGTLTGRFVPVLCGTAIRNQGVVELLDAMLACLPSPEERARLYPVRGMGDDSKPIVRDASTQESLAALVFKTHVDPFAGKVSLFRVYSGSLKADSSVFNATQGVKERVGQLFYPLGKRQVPTPEVPAGRIGAVAKLKETTTWDTLVEEARPMRFEPVHYSDPVISFAIEPKSRGDEEKVSAGLHRLLEEDPTLRFHRDGETSEMILSGMGQVHLEVTLERLKRQFGVEVEMKTPKVPYRETIRGSARVHGKYKKQTGGRGQYGDCWIEVGPLPRSAGFEFVNRIVGGVIPRQYIPAVEKGVVEAMREGSLAGYPLVDMRVTLVDGSHHSVDSSEMAFKIAGSMALKKAVQDAKAVLLEPIMQVEILVPEDSMGQVIGDLNSRRGRVQGVQPQANSQKILAQVPMAEMLLYSRTLRSLTSGRGVYSMEFLHYEQVPSHMVGKVVAQETQKTEGSG